LSRAQFTHAGIGNGGVMQGPDAHAQLFAKSETAAQTGPPTSRETEAASAVSIQLPANRRE
jgi:hypothetical protein